MIVLIFVFLALLVLGFWALWFTCAGKPLPDLTDPSVLEQPRWKPYRELILEGRRWLDTQQVRPLQVMSYDGKMLYGRFVPCENARGTILLFPGYRSTYAVDFSIALELYHSNHQLHMPPYQQLSTSTLQIHLDSHHNMSLRFAVWEDQR